MIKNERPCDRCGTKADQDFEIRYKDEKYAQFNRCEMKLCLQCKTSIIQYITSNPTTTGVKK